MNISLRRWLLRSLPTILGLVLVGYIACSVPWRRAGAALVQVDLAWVGVTWVVATAGISVRALRLKVLLDAPPGPVWRSVVLGYFASLAFPFGGGELVKMAALRHQAKVPGARAVSAVGLDRMFDAAALLLLFALVASHHLMPGLRLMPLLILGGIFAAMAGFTGLLLLRGHWLGRLLEERFGSGERASRLLAAFNHLHEQVRQLRKGRILAALLGCQSAVFTLDVLGAWCGLRAFPFTAQLPLMAALQLSLSVMLAFALPLLPGSLGTLQVAYVLALAPYGVLKEQSVAFSLVGQAGHTAVLLILGVVALAGCNLRWRSLREWSA